MSFTTREIVKRLSPWRATQWLVALSVLLHLAVAGRIGLGVDDAHYALYGLHLDWSYFDHPPLVGWLQSLVLLFSSSDVALRIMPLMLFSGASLVMFHLTVKLFPDETPWLGFIAVCIFQSGLMFQLLGTSLQPDGPLLLLGMLTILALQGVLAIGSLRNWLFLGVCLGLAGLSKYTAITLVITVLVVLFFRRRRGVRVIGPWLAVFTALLLILPVLYWNYRHDWISFLYQLHHGTGNLHWQAANFLKAEGVQLAVYGPGIFLFGIVASAAAMREWRNTSVLLCLALSWPVLLLFGWNAGYQMTLPHWPALGWAGLAPLAARWLYRSWDRRSVRVSASAAAIYSLVLIVVLFSEFFSPWLPFADNRNPLRDLYGWSQAALKAESLREEMAATEGTKPVLFTNNWSYASRLAWYARPSAVQVLDGRFDQFDIWFGSPQQGARGILVTWPDSEEVPSTGGTGKFASCALRDKLPVFLNGHLVSTFSFYACYGYRN